jgi:2-methylcitrate dehydratase PrpD
MQVPARAAVASALLASVGVTGFETPLDGRAGFFKRSLAVNMTVQRSRKGWANGLRSSASASNPGRHTGGTHSSIEAALAMRVPHR